MKIRSGIFSLIVALSLATLIGGCGSSGSSSPQAATASNETTAKLDITFEKSNGKTVDASVPDLFASLGITELFLKVQPVNIANPSVPSVDLVPWFANPWNTQYTITPLLDNESYLISLEAFDSTGRQLYFAANTYLMKPGVNNISITARSPVNSKWSRTVAANEPTPRQGATSVWTGSEFLVWGGQEPAGTNTGGAFNPVTKTWRTIPYPNPPFYLGSTDQVSVWSGTNMIVLDTKVITGGQSGHYNPVTNTWTDAGTPPGWGANFTTPVALWTGSEMLVLGNTAGGVVGYKFRPGVGWSTISAVGAPTTRANFSAVLTASGRVIVFGGFNAGTYFANGYIYDPAGNAWSAITAIPAAVAGRSQHAAGWFGSEMLIVGGYTTGAVRLADGWRYNPVTNTWRQMNMLGGPYLTTNLSSMFPISSTVVSFNGFNYDLVNDSWARSDSTGMPRSFPYSNGATIAVASTPTLQVFQWGGVKTDVTGASLAGPQYLTGVRLYK